MKGKVMRPLDDRRLQADHLKLIPPERYRTGEQSTLAEYAYNDGIIAAYIGEHLTVKDPQILDLGCGTGKLVAATWPFLGEQGHYTGMDVNVPAMRFAKSWYPKDRCTFIYAPVHNAYYNPQGIPPHLYVWPIEDRTVDLAVAFSLFTHLNQPDSTLYFEHLARVLKPGGVALLAFFYLDDHYDAEEHISTRWNFDRTIEGQPEWRWPLVFKVPERQIGITPAGVESLMAQNFELVKIHQGHWTGHPGALLQDTLVFRRRS